MVVGSLGCDEIIWVLALKKTRHREIEGGRKDRPKMKYQDEGELSGAATFSVCGLLKSGNMLAVE